MYSKYKKRRKKVSTKFILFVMILILVLIGSGYSLWSSNLYINGNINLKYKEPKLENIDIVSSSNQLISVSMSGIFSSISVKSSNKFDDDTFGVNSTITGGGSWFGLSVTVTMTFTNKNSSSLTNGKVDVIESSGITVNRHANR